MKIDVRIEGMQAVRANLEGMAKQVRFAAAKTLTQTAYDINADIKEELKRNIQGGPTAFTLRAFKVGMAKPQTLASTVSLRDDAEAGGPPYTKALRHLFVGGGRQWKRLEGWLRAKGLIPTGMMAAPGPKISLDNRGNIKRSSLDEMLKILSSPVRNARVWRQSGKNKEQKLIGFFVCRPGDRSGLAPGIWRRIEGAHSVVEPWIMFIRPVAYRQKFDFEKIAKKTVDRVFQDKFRRNLEDAMRSAR